MDQVTHTLGIGLDRLFDIAPKIFHQMNLQIKENHHRKILNTNYNKCLKLNLDELNF